MERNQFSSDFGDGAKFSETEIAHFQHEHVIPTLNNYLWRGDFLSDAIPGCVVKKIAPLEEGDSSNWAEIEMEYLEDHEAVFITLTIYQNDESYTQELINGYKAEYIEAQKRSPKYKKSKKESSKHKANKKKRVKAPRLKTEEHSAWKLTTFNFSPNDSDGFSVNRNFELRDKSNCVIWSTDTFIWDQERSYADFDKDSDIEDLNELFDTSITQEDMFLIIDAFKALRILPE